MLPFGPASLNTLVIAYHVWLTLIDVERMLKSEEMEDAMTLKEASLSFA
jgi:hypothetical protein